MESSSSTDGVLVVVGSGGGDNKRGGLQKANAVTSPGDFARTVGQTVVAALGQCGMLGIQRDDKKEDELMRYYKMQDELMQKTTLERDKYTKLHADERALAQRSALRLQELQIHMHHDIAKTLINTQASRTNTEINNNPAASGTNPLPMQPALTPKISRAQTDTIQWLLDNDIISEGDWDVTTLVRDFGCTKGEDILDLDENDWGSAGFKKIALMKLKKLKSAK